MVCVVHGCYRNRLDGKQPGCINCDENLRLHFLTKQQCKHMHYTTESSSGLAQWRILALPLDANPVSFAGITLTRQNGTVFSVVKFAGAEGSNARADISNGSASRKPWRWLSLRVLRYGMSEPQKAQRAASLPPGHGVPPMWLWLSSQASGQHTSVGSAFHDNRSQEARLQPTRLTLSFVSCCFVMSEHP